MPRLLALLFAFPLFLSLLDGASSQDSKDKEVSAKDVFVKLKATTDKISGKARQFAEIDKQAPSAIEKLSKDVTALVDLNGKKPMPAFYLASLNNDAKLLASVDLEKVTKEGYKTITVVSIDIGIKLAHANNKPNSPYMVKAIAETVDAQQRKVPGLEVWYVQKGHEDNKQHHMSFNKLSTPTSKDLSPGMWVFWTKDPGDDKKTGKTKDVQVRDENGKDECPFDLAAPK